MERVGVLPRRSNLVEEARKEGSLVGRMETSIALDGPITSHPLLFHPM
jgi:hypothetical protein